MTIILTIIKLGVAFTYPRNNALLIVKNSIRKSLGTYHTVNYILTAYIDLVICILFDLKYLKNLTKMRRLIYFFLEVISTV